MPEATIQIHRCRFLDYSRPFISAMSFSTPSVGSNALPDSNLRLAVGRSNGDIEIWNFRGRWYHDITLMGAKGRSIEGLVWSVTDDAMRLFSVGGSNELTEWDLRTGQPITHASAHAGVIWAIDVSPNGSRLAVACENGAVVVFDISGGRGSVEYIKRLQAGDASLASIAWKGDNQIVAGGMDRRLRVWDVASSRGIAVMKVDRGQSPEDTFVWTVKTLPKTDQIISGDSNGNVKIWDGKLFSLQQSLQAHESDILALAISAEGDTVFSAGLDQKIVCYRMTRGKDKKWAVMSSRVAHSHDVRCMSSYEARGISLLVSGGLESTFVTNSVSEFDTKLPTKVPLTRQHPSIQLDARRNLILEWREQQVRLWHLNDGSKKLLLKMNIAETDDYISSASLMGDRLAVASYNSIRMFKLEGLTQAGHVSEIQKTNSDLKAIGAHHVLFMGSDLLLIISPLDEIGIYNCETTDLYEVEEPAEMRTKKSKYGYATTILHVAVSPSQTHFAVAKHCGFVEVYDINTRAHVGSLPAVSDIPTAMTFRNDQRIVVACADMCVLEYDLSEMTLTSWARQNMERLPLKLKQQKNVCCGAFADPEVQDRIWLWGANWLAFLDLSCQNPDSRSRKRKPNAEVDQTNGGGDDANSNTAAFWITQRYKPIFYAGIFGSGILVSERPPLPLSDTHPFWSNRRIRV